MGRKHPFPKIQHYVPQFILKNFTSGKKPQLYVFDKERGVVFQTHVKNVSSEGSFYDFEINGYKFSIEPALEGLETQTAESINKILKEKSLSNISSEERITLSTFIAVQIYRTRFFREKISQLYKDMEARIRECGFEPAAVKGFPELDAKGLRDSSIRMVIKTSGGLVPHILDKKWLLYTTQNSNPFYISDNPVARQNIRDYGLWGNLGLAIRGIEIYFPLSKTISLAMLCPSHEETFWDTYHKHKILERLQPNHIKPKADTSWLENLRKGFEAGAVVPMRPAAVINHNSLQVKWSCRFVFSSTDNFKLVRDMISSDQRFKKGLGELRDVID